MKIKKSLVVYHSTSGFTKKLATEISKNINCDIEEIKSSSSYVGIIGHLRALFQAILKKEPQIHQLKHSPSDYDIVFVGSPVWNNSPSAPVRTFLDYYKNNIKNVAFFSTQGSLKKRISIFEQMKNILGKNPLANLSVSDKEITDGTFLKKVPEFISMASVEKN